MNTPCLGLRLGVVLFVMLVATVSTHAETQIEKVNRPEYHFLPPSGWMNDPNGPVFFNEQYHLFFQHNPESVEGPPNAIIRWGHAVSKDLLHWTYEGIALEAGEDGSMDAAGVWSGNSLVEPDGERVRIYYTGVRHGAGNQGAGLGDLMQTQLTATSSDDLKDWDKDPVPLITDPPFKTLGWRDPFVYVEGEKSVMLIGSGTEDEGGSVLMYTQDADKKWVYKDKFLAGDAGVKDMECPQLFKLEDKHVLLFSNNDNNAANRHVYYYMGSFDMETLKFTPMGPKRVIDNGNYYAADIMVDTSKEGNGRIIMFGWVMEERDSDAVNEAGWAGVQAIPRVLSMCKSPGPANTLCISPLADLKDLHVDNYVMERLGAMPSASLISVPDIQSQTLEIHMSFKVDATFTKEVNICVLVSEQFEERTCIVYFVHNQHLLIDRRDSSTSTGPAKTEVSTVLDGNGDFISLDIFVDKSIIEVFANDLQVLTTRVYPAGTGATQITYPTQTGTGATLEHFRVYEMECANCSGARTAGATKHIGLIIAFGIALSIFFVIVIATYLKWGHGRKPVNTSYNDLDEY